MKTTAFVAACLLAAAFSVQAAQKSPKKPAPTQTETAPQDIDVDALARAKDVDANAAAPTQDGETTSASAPSVDAPPADAPPTDAPPADAPSIDAPPATDAPAAGDAATSTEASDAPPPDAAAANPSRPAPLAPPSDAQKSLVAGCESRATALLDAAQKGDFAAATRDFDANMRSKLKPEQLRKAWDSLAQFGDLQARGQSHAAESEGYIAITVPLIFEKANLYAQVACGSDGRVAGFYVKPIESPAQ